MKSSSVLDWNSFCTAVRTLSPSLADVLKKTAQKFEDKTLILIPEKPIYKTILSSKNNAEVLKKSLPEGYGLQILDSENAVISTNNAQFSKISAIMGGEVKEVKDENGGENPF